MKCKAYEKLPSNLFKTNSIKNWNRGITEQFLLSCMSKTIHTCHVMIL